MSAVNAAAGSNKRGGARGEGGCKKARHVGHAVGMEGGDGDTNADANGDANGEGNGCEWRSREHKRGRAARVDVDVWPDQDTSRCVSCSFGMCGLKCRV